MYNVIWDVSVTKIKSYESRHEALAKFREVIKDPACFLAQVTKAETNYVLHNYDRDNAGVCTGIGAQA